MLLTAKELAQEFDLHITTIRRAYRMGRIPHERLCKMYLFDLEKVRHAMRLNGLTLVGGEDGLRAQPTSPRLGKTAASTAQNLFSNSIGSLNPRTALRRMELELRCSFPSGHSCVSTHARPSSQRALRDLTIRGIEQSHTHAAIDKKRIGCQRGGRPGQVG